MTPPLTPRERDVARELLAGRNYAEIGHVLGITVRTVRAHVLSIALRIEGSDPPVRRAMRLAARFLAEESS